MFLIPDSTALSFRDELGLICRSHNEDFEWIEKVLISEKKMGSSRVMVGKNTHNPSVYAD